MVTVRVESDGSTEVRQAVEYGTKVEAGCRTPLVTAQPLKRTQP